jgi:hypothetical protein
MGAAMIKDAKTVSATIQNHPLVAVCNDGEGGGFDYKYDVELIPGYEFGTGRMEGCTNARFHTIREFLRVAKTIRPRS